RRRDQGMGLHDKTIDDGSPVRISHKIGITIGDPDQVWDFYNLRFQNCQQTACKRICNAWVKAIVPKTQSTHPYMGDKIPDWWPTGPFGSDKTDYVQYREPDDLPKKG
ncbi:hypothetical protein B0T19DRAFT_457540, partial [Cercophora scortea]